MAFTVPDTPLKMSADRPPRRVPDEAAHVHVVPFLHDGFAQRSDMLLHGQHDFAWDGHVDGFQFRRVLAMGHDGASRASESRQ